MNDTDRKAYISEVQLQCAFALAAFRDIEGVLADRSTWGKHISTRKPAIHELFRHIHSFLSHVGNVSKLFWPPAQAARARGTDLTTVLGVTSPSPLELRTLRNHIEHYDERLDTWIVSRQGRGAADLNLLSEHLTFGKPPSDMHRNLDPDTYILTFQGDRYDLRAVEASLATTMQAAEAWLSSHP